MNKHPLRIAALLGSLALATSACGSVRGERATVDFPEPEVQFVDDADTADAADAAGAATAAEQVAAEDRPVIEVDTDDVGSGPFAFSATEFETGDTINGIDLYDRGLVLMGFSLPSCPVCHTEAPKTRAAALLNPDITYVVVHSGASEREIGEFVDEHELRADNIVHLLDPDRDLWVRFGVAVQPYYVLVDVNGTLSGSTGALGDHGLERAAERLRTGA